MDSRVAYTDVDFGVLPVSDEALGACVEKGFGVLWLGAGLEDLSVVDDKVAIGARQRVACLLFLVLEVAAAVFFG